MAPDHDIYRVLLELKETAGSTSAKIDDIKKSIEEQNIKHDELHKEHIALKQSHDSYKGKILLVSGGVGAFFGALGTWLWNYITGSDK